MFRDLYLVIMIGLFICRNEIFIECFFLFFGDFLEIEVGGFVWWRCLIWCGLWFFVGNGGDNVFDMRRSDVGECFSGVEKWFCGSYGDDVFVEREDWFGIWFDCLKNKVSDCVVG